VWEQAQTMLDEDLGNKTTFGFHFAFVSDDAVWAFWPHGETDPERPVRRAQMFTEADGWTHIRQPIGFPRLFKASQWVRAGPLFVSFYQEYSDHGLDPQVWGSLTLNWDEEGTRCPYILYIDQERLMQARTREDVLGVTGDSNVEE
ncbi:hypothetical protein KIPB_013325, partial [Kipferlia bialata]